MKRATSGELLLEEYLQPLIFEVREDEAGGGYIATALGYGIHTQGETTEELRAMVKDAVDCYFDETMDAPLDHPAPLCSRRNARRH